MSPIKSSDPDTESAPLAYAAPMDSKAPAQVAPEGLEHIGETVQALRDAFETGRTIPLDWRRAQLDGLMTLLTAHQDELADALNRDLGKPPFESWLSEIQAVMGRVKTYQKNLRKWTRPKRVSSLLAIRPAKSVIVREPLGVVLVMTPWNFPVELCIAPLCGAIAAGNCALIKPSELAPATSACLAALFPKYVDNDCVKVIEGGIPEATELLRHPFDHLFFIGNHHVGRIVMRAAAEHLTPVTLELGGKNPCIVDRSADLAVTAKRVLWGKLLNAGQVCVATDYLLVHDAVHDALIEKLKETIRAFLGDDPKQSPDFGRIVNQRHFERIVRLLESGGTIVHGGETDAAERYIAPTLITDIPDDAAILREEIFGPLLPIIRVPNVDDAIHYVNARPSPLAIYMFANDRTVSDRVVAETRSGGVCVNATVYQILGEALPFGGVGPSGLGKYHGRYSIDAFSNLRGVVTKPTWLDNRLAYPPATKAKKRWLRRLV